MIIDSHVHIGKLPNSLYNDGYDKNLILILKEAKENRVGAKSESLELLYHKRLDNLEVFLSIKPVNE